MADRADNNGDEMTPEEVLEGAAAARYLKDEPAAAKALEIIMRLVTETAVLRERLDTVEQLLAMKGTITSQDIDDFEPEESVLEARQAWRREFLERLLS